MIFITLVLISFFHHHTTVDAGNVLLFPMFSRSQLLGTARMASILSDDGHNVTIVIATNDEEDIETSSKYNILFYKTSLSRELELSANKVAPKVTAFNLLLGKIPNIVQDIMGQRCAGLLFDVDLHRKLSELKPDLAIVNSVLPCIIPFLNRMHVPFLDFCTGTLMHAVCGYPHRIPSPPSYVPDGLSSDEPNTFLQRVLNSMVWYLGPNVFPRLILGVVQQEMYKYQQEHGLPHEDMFELRSKASFLLVQGDLAFETVRPIIPKVVYIGGLQCNDPKPLEGDLHDFVDAAGGDLGLIIFSLGGVLDTDSLPDRFIEIFLNIFRELSHRVVWKLKRVPTHLQKRIPSNVKIVDWMPQQDLLGHPKTKLFISHGGIQGAYESICHGVPTLGVSIFSDQTGNINILVKKGLALSISNYNTMTVSEVKEKIHKLLSDDTFRTNALHARTLFTDQPQTAAQRLAFAVGYTIRHKGAHHLTSDAALRLHWFQYYSLDVYVFFFALFLLLSFVCYTFIRLCLKCCVSLWKRTGKCKDE